MTVDQLLSALESLGVCPVLDPEVRPYGPEEADRTLLLGMLLAAVEAEAVVAIPELCVSVPLANLVSGWREQIGGERSAVRGALRHRLERTFHDLDVARPDPVDESNSAEAMAIIGAMATVTTSAHLLHLSSVTNQPERARHALKEASRWMNEAAETLALLDRVLGV